MRAIMSEGGAALMAVGKASGEDRARAAAEAAISSQLLDITIDGARGILFNVTGGPSLTLFEVNQAAAIIKETAHPDVNLIFGAVIDPNMTDELRVTVIATGFDRTGAANPLSRVRVDTRPEPQRGAKPQQSQPQYEDAMISARQRTIDRTESPINMPQPTPVEFQRVVNTEDLDIPAFLRNRSR